LIKSLSIPPDNDVLLSHVLLILLHMPHDSDTHVMHSTYNIIHIICKNLDKHFLTSPLVLHTRPLGHDAPADSTKRGYKIVPDKCIAIYKRFLEKNAGSMGRSIPEAELDAGARADRISEFFAARHVAKVVLTLLPMLLINSFRGDLFFLMNPALEKCKFYLYTQ